MVPALKYLSTLNTSYLKCVLKVFLQKQRIQFSTSQMPGVYSLLNSFSQQGWGSAWTSLLSERTEQNQLLSSAYLIMVTFCRQNVIFFSANYHATVILVGWWWYIVYELLRRRLRVKAQLLIKLLVGWVKKLPGCVFLASDARCHAQKRIMIAISCLKIQESTWDLTQTDARLAESQRRDWSRNKTNHAFSVEHVSYP